jgi:predicted DNA-binding protein
MGFRISDEMLQEVEALCEHTGLSKTDLILQAIQSYIDSNRSLMGIAQHS